MSDATTTPASTSPVATAATPTPSVIKPGYKTSEFWLSAAATCVGLVIASGLIPTTGDWPKIAGLVVGLLGAMGYTVNRSMVKAAALFLLMCAFLGWCAGCNSITQTNYVGNDALRLLVAASNAPPGLATADLRLSTNCTLRAGSTAAFSQAATLCSPKDISPTTTVPVIPN